MALVTIIKEVAKVAIRINRKYKYLNINDKFVRKYVPPGYRKSATRAIRIAEGITLGIPIYEALDFALQKQKLPTSDPYRKTRDYMEQSGPKRFQRTNYRSRDWCKPRYKRRR